MKDGILTPAIGVIFVAVGVVAVVSTISRPLQQIGTANFTPVEAVVISSAEPSASHRTRGLRLLVDQLTSEWQVGYVYEVGGNRLFSTQKALVYDRAGGYGSPFDAKRAFPPKSRITAFVDPTDQTRVVLRRGGRAVDFLVPALVSMLVPIGLCLVTLGVSSIRRLEFPFVAADLEVIDSNDRISVSLSRANPVIVGFAVSALVLAGGTMVNGAVTGQLPGAVLFGLAAVVALAAGAGVAASHCTRLIRRGPAAMLTFDRAAGTVQLPMGGDRRGWPLLRKVGSVTGRLLGVVNHQSRPLVLQRNQITEVRVVRREVQEADDTSQIVYLVTLNWMGKDGSPQSFVVHEFPREWYAESLAQWCRERLLELAAAGM